MKKVYRPSLLRATYISIESEIMVYNLTERVAQKTLNHIPHLVIVEIKTLCYPKPKWCEIQARARGMGGGEGVRRVRTHPPNYQKVHIFRGK